MNRIEITFEDIALKNRLLKELEVKACREELRAGGQEEYTPAQFGAVVHLIPDPLKFAGAKMTSADLQPAFSFNSRLQDPIADSADRGQNFL